MPVKIQQQTFPHFLPQVRRLVRQHVKLKDEPLRLAIYYSPQRDRSDVFLFEVVDNFGAGGIDPEKKLFEVTYASSPGFELEDGQELHLILTNPRELEVAFAQQWPLAQEIREAVLNGQSRIVHSDKDENRFMEMIRGR